MATVTINPETLDLNLLPGIPALAGELVSRGMTREEDPERFDATKAYIEQYMGDVNSEPGGQPELLSYYAEACAAFSAGFAAARQS